MSNEPHPTGGTPSPTTERAVVLGGGGVAGIAWESGLLAGLMHAGVSLGDADAFGTSAGSVVATLLRSGRLRPEALGDLMPASDSGVADRVAAAESGDEASSFDWLTFTQMLESAAAGATDERDARARLGRRARDIEVSMGLETWLGRIASLVPGEWPSGRLGVTVVDATDGSFRVIEAGDGVPLTQAVAASCTVPTVFPLVPIDGRPHMDGGMRSATNADVAVGYDRVLVVACVPEPGRSAYGPTLEESVAQLRRSAKVHVITPDDATARIFAGNMLSGATRAPAAQAGWAQAEAIAAQIEDFWGSPAASAL